MTLFRAFRIVVLLTILVVVAGGTWLTSNRLADWQEPVFVVVYPIDADNSLASRAYMRSLRRTSFDAVGQYLAEQGKRYGVRLRQPLNIELAPAIGEPPPAAPKPGDWLGAIWWSLYMRWWAWRHDSFAGSKDVRLFLLYHDPGRTLRLRHSVGLEKARLGVVNLFASHRLRGSNQVVLTHELLHTLGATDKYDLATGQPIYPDGYADPDRGAHGTQTHAEIMAGRIPGADGTARQARSLKQTKVGGKTAAEIGWRRQ